MAEESNNVAAEIRDQFGKGAARRIRAAGKIPAVLYGHGTAPVHMSLPGHQMGLLLRRANAIIDLDVSGKKHTALVKDVQRDPVRQVIEHVDLIVIRKGERVHVDVAIHVDGEAASGTAIDLDAKSLLLEAPAENIPDHLIVDVTDREAGSHIYAADVPLPAGCTLMSDPEILVVAVSVPAVQDLGETEVEQAAEAAEGGEATEEPVEGASEGES